MVLMKIKMPNEENTVSRDKFVINSLFPIGFKESNVEGCFIFLFAAYQDFKDKIVYLQFIFDVEDNADEYSYLLKHNNYIPNYKDKIEKMAVYKKMCDSMTDDNVYTTDFIMTHGQKAFYYDCNAVRMIDKDSAAVLDLYIPLNVFIQIKIFLENLCPRTILFPGHVFSDPKLRNFDSIVIDSIKREESTFAGDKSLYVDTHYTLNCGPSTFKLNYRTFKIKDTAHYELADELDQELYYKSYGIDFYLDYIVRDGDDLLLVYSDTYTRYGEEVMDKCPSKVLKIPKSLIKNTNFLDQYNKIYKRKV